MISPHELRLGNLVLAPELWKEQFFTVLELYAEECSVSPDVKNQSRIVSYPSLVPIPLSLSLLKGFRFKTEEYSTNKVMNYTLLRQGNHHFYLDSDLQPVKSPAYPIPLTSYRIGYFHQLQNLFYTATGEDLTLFASWQ